MKIRKYISVIVVNKPEHLFTVISEAVEILSVRMNIAAGEVNGFTGARIQFVDEYRLSDGEMAEKVEMCWQT